jgi:uncharacterized membrane protein
MTADVLLVTLMAALLYATPVLTRPDIFFAVTIPPEFRGSPDGRAVLSRYRWQIVAAAALGLTLVSLAGASAPEKGMLWGFGTFSLVSFAAYLRARHAVLPHAVRTSSAREASLAPRSRRLPGGWAGQAGPFVLLLLAAAILRARWADLPDRIPMHWSLSGTVDRWADKTVSGVYGSLVMAAAVAVVMWLIAVVLVSGSRRIYAEGPLAAREDKFRHTVLLLLLASEYMVTLNVAGSGTLLALHVQPSVWFVVAPITIVIIGFGLALVLMGQGGARTAPPDGTPVGDRTADRYWIAGVIYINADDPAILVERRFGIGYTLNLGNPRAWLLVAVIVLIVALGRFVVRAR